MRILQRRFYQIKNTGLREMRGNTSQGYPPGTPSMDGDEVHVWFADLREMVLAVGHFSSIISGDERERAERFHFRQDRDDFVVSKGLLRVILGRYLDREPQTLRFFRDPYGKPALDPEENGQGLCFNASHSNGLYLLALTRWREIGGDVEYLRNDFPFDRIIKRFFTEGEADAFRVLPPKSRRNAFFSCWTRKEAYLKATGRGLSFPLEYLEVTGSQDQQPRIRNIRGDCKETSSWSIQDIDVGPGFAAAIAVKGTNWRLSLRKWEEWQSLMKPDQRGGGFLPVV